MDADRRSMMVLDLEATCDDDPSFRRREMETIEIGAVLVDIPSLVVIDEFQAFVRPVRHPILTRFCTRLTSITQEQVDQARGFVHVFEALVEWLAGFPAPRTFASWGDYDRHQLQRDCGFHGIPYALPDDHLNLKAAVAHHLGLDHPLGMAQMLDHLGLELHGVHHRGIDDARNIARMVPWALGRAGEPSGR